MKTLIVYKTNTGFTKEYVDILNRRVNDATVVPIEKLNKKLIKESDIIFYGGPLRNNVILGLNKFLKHYDLMEGKDVFIFAVGIQPLDDEKRENVIAANGLEFYHVRLYFLQGGMDLQRMKPLQRKMMMLGLKMASKQNQGVDVELLRERLSTPLNFVSSSNLDRMVDVYHRVILNRKTIVNS